MQFIDLHRQREQFRNALDTRIQKILSDAHFIGGAEIGELEEKLAAYTGVQHVLACASGTDALTLSLMALDLEKNDAVFVPSFTFFASAESVSLAGGTPVFTDVSADTFNMDPSSLEDAIARVEKEGRLHPRGIVAVDLFGQPADYLRIRKIAEKNGLFILEDAAQGFGGRIGEKKAASFGDVAGTSFFPAKPLGCYGDGGAVFTNSDELYAKLKSIHVHGQGSNKYDNVRIGLNSRLDTLQAAVLLEKLAIFEEEFEKRNAVAARYTENLKTIVKTPVVPDGFKSSWAQYTVQVESEKVRTALIAALKAEDIPAMIYYPTPIHLSTAYKSANPGRHLPVAERLSKTVMSLPMHPYLTEEEQEQICAVIRKNI